MLYVIGNSKDALWIHLDMHEISDANKELHHQEVKVERKMHQCVLCNDKRAYSEGSYKNHVQVVHDGKQNFSSEKHKLDHELFHCVARVLTVKSIIPTFTSHENGSNIIK